MFKANLRRLTLANIHWIVLVAILVIGVAITTMYIRVESYIEHSTTTISSTVVEQKKHIDDLKAGISQDNIRRREILCASYAIKRTNPVIPYVKRNEYATYIVNEIERAPDVDLALALAIARKESHFVEDAKSYIEIRTVKNGKQIVEKKVNAVGIYQLVNRTARGVAKELGIAYNDTMRYDPMMNTKMGIWYIQDLINEYDGAVDYALAHYANGYNGARTWGMHKKWRHNKEYQQETAGSLRKKLHDLGVDNPDVIETDTQQITKYKEMLLGKSLPLQASIYVPKVLEYRNEFNELIETVDLIQISEVD